MPVPRRTAQCCCTCTVPNSNISVWQPSVPKVASSFRSFKTDGQTDRHHSAPYKQFFSLQQQPERESLSVCLSLHSRPQFTSLGTPLALYSTFVESEPNEAVSQTTVADCCTALHKAHFNVLCRNMKCQRPCLSAMNQNPQIFDLPWAEVVVIAAHPLSM